MNSIGKTSPAELLAIGEILRPRGVRGELKLRLLCSSFEDFLECLEAGDFFLWWPSSDAPVMAPERSANLSAVMSAEPDVSSPESTETSPQAKIEPSPRKRLSRQLQAGAPYLAQAESVRFHAGFVLLQLGGVETLEDAELLRGAMIGLRAADVPQPEEDAFYQFELEGLRVLGADGEQIGVVESVQENPANDLLMILPDNPQQKPFLLPLVEAFIKRVDIAGGTIEVDLPEGLIEPVEP